MASMGSPVGGVNETKKTPTKIYQWEQGRDVGLCWLCTAQLQRPRFSNMESHWVGAIPRFKMAHNVLKGAPAGLCGQGPLLDRAGRTRSNLYAENRNKTRPQMDVIETLSSASSAPQPQNLMGWGVRRRGSNSGCSSFRRGCPVQFECQTVDNLQPPWTPPLAGSPH